MSELVFDVIDAKAEHYSAAPTITFALRVAETTGEPVHCINLRCQLRIEPLKRRYSDAEGDCIVDLFGDRARWGDTMKPLQFANLVELVPGFTGTKDVALKVPLTYDFDVATAKYFHGLDDGEVPFVFLFSGTLFLRGETGFSVEQVPWHKEASYRLPVSVWREAMDVHFPGAAWVRLQTSTLDALQRFKSRLALPTWEATIEALLLQAGEAAAPANGRGHL